MHSQHFLASGIAATKNPSSANGVFKVYPVGWKQPTAPICASEHFYEDIASPRALQDGLLIGLW